MDISYLLFLQNIRNSLNGVFNEFFALITNISVDFYIIIIPLVIYWAVDKKKGIFIYLSYGLGCLINAVAKSAFCIYRPWIIDSRVKPLDSVMSGASGYSFPSGHSTSVSSTYFPLAYNYKKHKKLITFCIIMVLLTMFSRNFVGVHTLKDVLVGCLIGVVSTYVIAYIEKYVDKHPEKDWIVLLVAVIVTVLSLVYVATKSYPETYVDGKLLVDPASMKINSFKDPGTFFGVVLAWFVERRFINVNISGTAYQKTMRCIAGVFLMIAYYSIVVNSIGKLINTNIVYFLLRASVPFVFICLYPLCWKKK